MKFKTIQASAFRAAFEVLKDILTDVNISFTREGMKILTLDTARVSLVQMELGSDNFEEYECKIPILAGVNLSNMFKLLKSVGNKDVLTIEIINPEYMSILIENDAKKSTTKFELKLLDINEDKIGEPDVNIDVVDTLASVDFQRLCRDMGNIASEIVIKRTINTLIFSCEGDFANQITTIECSSCEHEISGSYSLKYLNTFTKATGLSANMQIMQEPASKFLIIRYNVADLGYVNFYLATKTSSEY